MDPFDSSALKLQKNLLTLRRARDRLRQEGNDKEADQLAQQIARIEAVLSNMQGTIRPPTLQ
ncbi:hypothetical protein OGV25_08235 [Pseudomonas sp. P1B16]|jgi:hypothetical protein|uniref:Uncharacterized protein n=1 Tax=Pseudomonas capeferrum TaxID=1495066 RepID=A0ABY7RDU7_9PSED|nr:MULTISPECIES: hypothetical protein [Pseudomonas]KEY87658.1 hypothetical protein PC358_00635 [Pseudomonas capeferrum]KGI94500.1 hypothetical protein MD26_04870 [Pseudomonas sp. H2]MBC3482934.1 hypothetical protein [Pseudomonas sp. SWRI77]MBC3502836.1 hypothetical protein [Pseudomonas sp. SWRI59]MBC3507616.1 hypothetical protein [Pseudomonas sp. SWRI68]